MPLSTVYVVTHMVSLCKLSVVQVDVNAPWLRMWQRCVTCPPVIHMCGVGYVMIPHLIFPPFGVHNFHQ